MHQPAQSNFGRYEIKTLLGKGGMGEVYLAYDPVMRRSVAIKVLGAESDDKSDDLRRFQREAYAASSLNHPHILTVYEIGTADDRYFIASEFIDGKSLRDSLTGGPLPLREALDIAIQVASALASAHSAGIIHRDIKPENIMVRPDGIVKVLDFGLAKLADQSPQPTSDTTAGHPSTAPGFLVGTVTYMSPEQVRAQNVDPRTDLWSLGVVLYELVTGRRPFDGETTSDTIAAILKTDLLASTERLQAMPDDLVGILAKALRRDRAQRYQSADELESDLKSLRQRLEFQAELQRSFPDHPAVKLDKPRGERIPGPELRKRSVSTRRRMLVVLTALLAFSCLLGYLAYSRYSARQGNIASVAVLPFTNVSKDPELDYLADGLSESIINKLAGVQGLKVIARTSVSRYKADQVDAKAVARDLGVEAIVVGRVLQLDNNLRISTELVRTKDSVRLWGGQYTRHVGGWVAVQSDISEEIARRLRGQLTSSQSQQLARRETNNPQAYELLLKGRTYWRKGGHENWKRAIDCYQQAIVLDPNYAQAYAYLGASYKSLIGNSLLDPGEFRTAAEAAARRALELDPNLADAHWTMANIKTDAWDWAVAEQSFKRAIEINPNLAAAQNAYSAFLSVMGRHDESIASIRRARELDPFSLTIHANIGYRFYFARRYDEAIESLKRTLELDPNFALGHLLLGYAYSGKRMYSEAIAAYEQAARKGLDMPGTQVYLGAAHAQAGDKQKAVAILRRIQTSRTYFSPAELAVLHGALDQKEHAFQLLEQAFEAHDMQLQYLGSDPAFDPLRTDPRFDRLLKRIGLRR